MDLYTGEHALVGVSYMRSWGKADYTAEGFDGVMDNRLDTAYQYLYWQPHAPVSVWGIGGIGSGRVDVTEVGRTHDAAASFHMFAGGLDTPTRTDSEVAYGLTAFGGLLTPYSQLQLAGYGRALSVGTTWHARPAGRLPLRVGVEATRPAHTIGGSPETAVLVHMTAPF